MVADREYEKCYYCQNKAEYSQLVGDAPDEYAVTGVCKNHLNMGLIS